MKNSLIERWNSESPAFFKTVYKVAAWAVSGALAVISLKVTGTLSEIPKWVELACTYIVIAGTFAGVTAKLTKQ